MAPPTWVEDRVQLLDLLDRILSCRPVSRFCDIASQQGDRFHRSAQSYAPALVVVGRNCKILLIHLKIVLAISVQIKERSSSLEDFLVTYTRGDHEDDRWVLVN